MEIIDKIIELYKDGITCSKIQDITGIERHKVSKILKQNRINVRSYAKTSPLRIEEIRDKVIEIYSKGNSMLSISRLFKVPVSTIRGILKKNNIIIRKSKYSVDENFFAKIDFEKKAYILGLMYADGYNYEKGGKVLLEMTDKDIIYEVNETLNNEKPVMVREFDKKRNPTYRISVDNINFSKKLAEKGCHQAKTFTIRWPPVNIVPEKLLRHFLRGYFDGDGNFYFNQKINAKQIQIVGNLEFITEMVNFLTAKINLSKYYITQRHKDRSNNIRSLQISRWKDIINFINLIYKKSSIKIERKYAKCLSALSYFKNNKFSH